MFVPGQQKLLQKQANSTMTCNGICLCTGALEDVEDLQD
jgi:hypothetical protein